MPAPVGTPQTLYDKVLSAHIVDEKLDGTILLYIGKFESFTAFCIERTRPDKNPIRPTSGPRGDITSKFISTLLKRIYIGPPQPLTRIPHSKLSRA